MNQLATESPRAARSPAEPPSRRWRPRFAPARVRSGFRWLYVADATVLFGSMLVANLARFGNSAPTYPLWQYLVGFALATAVHIVVYYFGGLYEPEERLGHAPWLPRAVRQTMVAALLVGFAGLVSGRYLIPRANLVTLAVVIPVAITATRRLARKVRWHRFGRPRVVLVGDERDRRLCAAHLHDDDAAAEIVAELPDALHLVDTVIEQHATDVLLLGGTSLGDLYPDALALLDARGVSVLRRVTGLDTLLGLRAVREVAGMPFVPVQFRTLPRSQARCKRLIDIVIVTLTFPVVVPVLAALMVYVRIVAGRPVLYWQERVGQHGVVFSMVKLRTMVRDAEAHTGPAMAARRDPRLIRGCGWLRRTRLDELPQVWHVLRNEMSVVGPRPERPEMTERYEKEIPGYSRRYEIPPGLTGLAQVQSRYHTYPEYKLGHDLQYLVNWSPVLDLVIVARTIWVVLSGRA